MATPPSPLILASGSPRRRDLLTQVGVPLEVIPSHAPEPPHVEGDARVYCRLNARMKTLEVARRHPGRFVLGADTEVILDGTALGKPRDRAHGEVLLRALAGRQHVVMTAYALATPDGALFEGDVETIVEVTPLSADAIAGYLDTGEPFDKAGGYGIQGIGTFLVGAIRGSYSNVVGLPVAEVLALLASCGGPSPFSQ